jgi:hypothetical protein
MTFCTSEGDAIDTAPLRVANPDSSNGRLLVGRQNNQNQITRVPCARSPQPTQKKSYDIKNPSLRTRLRATSDSISKVFGFGQHTISGSVDDGAGGTTSADITILVADTESPVITGCPENITVQTGPGRTTCDQRAPALPGQPRIGEIEGHSETGPRLPAGTLKDFVIRYALISPATLRRCYWWATAKIFLNFRAMPFPE